MNIKETVVHIVVPIAAAAISGLAVFWLTPDWEENARNKGWVPISEWKHEATKKGWIEKSECPAFPLKLEITGPGNGSRILVQKQYFGNYRISTGIVTRLSKPIDKKSQIDIGIVIKSNKEDNYYIVFPSEIGTTLTQGNRVVRLSDIYVPFTPSEDSTFKIWVVAVDDKKTIGSRYIRLNDIQSHGSVLSMSNVIDVDLEIGS